MKRYNIFYQVHKGLRAFLWETGLLLQQTDYDNSGEAEMALAQLENLIDLFEKHAHSEDTYVFAAIKKFEPALVATFETEHEKDSELGEKMIELLKEFDLAVSPEEKIAAGKSIHKGFIEFMVFNLEHMAKEEDLVNQALWKYYDDEEIHGITQQILANIPPLAMSLFNKWMIRGLSTNEIVSWLKAVKHNAPDPVFESLMQSAEIELSTYRLQFVQEAIMEGAMVGN